MLASPLIELQKRVGATLGEAYGWHLPSVYSSMTEEYEAATQGVALVDRSYIGRLKLTGEDGLDLLNRLSTNKLEDLEVGQGMYTVLTSSKGRILDLLFVLRLEDHLLVLTGPQNRQKVADWIDFYTFTEDAVVQDVTEDAAMLALVGPRAASLLDELTEKSASSLGPYESMAAGIGGIEATLLRTDFLRLPGYDLVVRASLAQALWRKLLDGGAEFGIRPVGTEALEVVRVEQGVPVYGKELNEDHNPLEANLLEFVSFNKGCYVGQEVVARLNTYEKVQKYLVGLSWSDDTSPAPDAGLFVDGKKVGTVTSAIRSSRLERGVGLGYVRKAQGQPGTRLTLESADGHVATVEDLPVTR